MRADALPESQQKAGDPDHSDTGAQVIVAVHHAVITAPEDWLGVDDARALARVQDCARFLGEPLDALRSDLTVRETIIEIGQIVRVAGWVAKAPDARGATSWPLTIAAEYIVDPDDQPGHISLAADPG